MSSTPFLCNGQELHCTTEDQVSVSQRQHYQQPTKTMPLTLATTSKTNCTDLNVGYFNHDQNQDQDHTPQNYEFRFQHEDVNQTWNHDVNHTDKNNCNHNCLNENISDLSLAAEVEEHKQHANKHENNNKVENWDNENENNTENDNSMSELDYDYDLDNYDDDEEGLLEATKLHQVGYFDPDGVPYSYSIYTKQAKTKADNANEVNCVNGNDTTTNNNSVSQQLQKLQTINFQAESSDEEFVPSVFHFQEQGQDPYQFKIDPTLDDDGSCSQEELDDPPFYSIMDAFHAYTMQKRVIEANQKWDTATTIEETSPEARPVKVQFSERVELYSVETPTEDENENLNLQLITNNRKMSVVIHVEELRLEDGESQKLTQAQIGFNEVLTPDPCIPGPLNLNPNLGVKNDLAVNEFIETTRKSPVEMVMPMPTYGPVNADSYSYSNSKQKNATVNPNPTPTSPNAPISTSSDIISNTPISECPFHLVPCCDSNRTSSPSSKFPASSNITKAVAVDSLSLKLGSVSTPLIAGMDITACGPPVNVNSARAESKNLKRIQMCEKTQPSSQNNFIGNNKNISNQLVLHLKDSKVTTTKTRRTIGSSSGISERSGPDLYALRKERELKTPDKFIGSSTKEFDGNHSMNRHSIGDYSRRRIGTKYPTCSPSPSSASTSKSTSQDKLPSWKRSDGRGGAFIFATASDNLKSGRFKNPSTSSSFASQSQLRSHHTTATSGYAGSGSGHTKINPILQSILDPKNLELLTKSCHQNSAVFKELKAQILLHNVPKTLLQNRLSKKMIDILFDSHENQNQGKTKVKDKEAKNCNKTVANTNTNFNMNSAGYIKNKKINKSTSNNNYRNQNHPVQEIFTMTNISAENKNQSQECRQEKTPSSVRTAVVNVSNLTLNFQKETLSSKSKIQSSKKRKTTGTRKCIDEKEKMELRTLASAPDNSFTGKSSVNVNNSINIGSKWATRPEVIPRSQQSSASTFTKAVITKGITCSKRPQSVPAQAPVNKNRITLSHLDLTSSSIKSTALTQRHGHSTTSSITSHKRCLPSHNICTGVTGRCSSSSVSRYSGSETVATKEITSKSEKLVTENYEREERKKSKLEMGFESLGLHNNFRAIIASTALANSLKPSRASTSTKPSAAIMTNFSSTGNKCDFSSNSTAPRNHTVINRKIKCSS